MDNEIRSAQAKMRIMRAVAALALAGAMVLLHVVERPGDQLLAALGVGLLCAITVSATISAASAQTMIAAAKAAEKLDMRR